MSTKPVHKTTKPLRGYAVGFKNKTDKSQNQETFSIGA
jgi:hypothetical protein